MQTQEKLIVSKEWTTEERSQAIKLIDARLASLQTEDTEMRKTIRWEAPCPKDNSAKRDQLEQLVGFLRGSSSEFLELNKANFSEYIAD